ncbi:peptidase C39 [Paraburkholderia sp. CNPSo 3157]|uniref:Peptidase C39 n=1 Tax=Paraburkholderia franconis TaxID=2654983 RepID=A0A7X1N8C5_9BURK|nr:C39 family peptidase [Paraburkholderia franconis]MPW17155.1 peptidase C39 [Paraburkholderia franconis]
MSRFDRYPAFRLADAAVAFATCAMCATSHAQASIDTSTLAGVPLTKTVHSMRELRYRHIVSQQFDYSCGAAALATLLKYGYGIDIPETELIRRMMVFSTPEVAVKNGFSMLDMKKFVETIGLRGRGFRVNTDALYHLQIPVMVLMNIDGYEHFVIVKHAQDGRIFIADPALGNRILLEEDFAKTWNGLVFAVVGKPFRKDSPLLQDNESLALRLRERALTNGTAATPFVEYGLIKADLF